MKRRLNFIAATAKVAVIRPKGKEINLIINLTHAA
jgi:hypothetical protein